jgi:dTDP-4-amino-4,6-dideoxygalactose transaminase
MRALRRVADVHGLAIVEDAAHCVEGERDGVRPARLAETACFSFYATKSLTAGEGGAIATNDPELAARLRLLRLHGMTKSAYDRSREGYQHWDMVTLGWKYNMDNIQAAMLLPQLERLDAKWTERDGIARRYRERIAALPGVRLPTVIPGTRHAHHLFPTWVDSTRRDAVVARLQERGIGVVVNYRPVHLMTYFQETFKLSRGMFPEAERIGDATISLPFYAGLSDADLDEVVQQLAAAL